MTNGDAGTIRSSARRTILVRLRLTTLDRLSVASRSLSVHWTPALSLRIAPISPKKDPNGPFYFGDRSPRVEELLAWVEEYPVKWQKPRFDLAGLARSRWIDGVSTKDLVARYAITEVAIRNHYRRMRKSKFFIKGLTEEERKKVLIAAKC